MGSLVLELQKEALSKSSSVTDLLRKAYVVSRKLKNPDFEAWSKRELDGYGDIPGHEYPEYRKLYGTPKVWNPYFGWQEINFESVTVAENLSILPLRQSIAEIEHMVGKSDNGVFQAPYPGTTANQIMKAIKRDFQPSLHIQPAALVKILDAVRTVVLQWALQLEEDGILGEDMSFSKEEIATAQQAHYTINYFAGDVSHSQVQQGSSLSSQDRKS